MSIWSCMGSQVFSGELGKKQIGSHSIEIPMKQLATGLYQIKLSSGTTEIFKKLLINR